jgi:2-iminobutanoate/2-iminopropanoate deaminase
MSHLKQVSTQDALQPIASYSQAIDTGQLVFVSGHVGFDKEAGKRPDDIKDETKILMDSIKAVLAAAGLEMSSICTATVFITDLDLFEDMNEVYKTYFDEPYPARATVKVPELLLDCRVEIQSIAMRPPS